MSIREDAMGNIWGRWSGSDSDAGESYEDDFSRLNCLCLHTDGYVAVHHGQEPKSASQLLFQHAAAITNSAEYTNSEAA